MKVSSGDSWLFWCLSAFFSYLHSDKNRRQGDRSTWPTLWLGTQHFLCYPLVSRYLINVFSFLVVFPTLVFCNNLLKISCTLLQRGTRCTNCSKLLLNVSAQPSSEGNAIIQSVCPVPSWPCWWWLVWFYHEFHFCLFYQRRTKRLDGFLLLPKKGEKNPMQLILNPCFLQGGGKKQENSLLHLDFLGKK